MKFDTAKCDIEGGDDGAIRQLRKKVNKNFKISEGFRLFNN